MLGFIQLGSPKLGIMRNKKDTKIQEKMKEDKPKPRTLEEDFKEIDKIFKRTFGRNGPVRILTDVVYPKRPMSSPVSKPPKPSKKNLSKLKFNLNPKEVKSILDKNIIHQDEAKKVLSIAICDHYNHVDHCLKFPKRKAQDYAKQNVLMLGPTGVGKTYLVRELAKLVGVPFVKADATRFSETGYVGSNVDDLIKDLVSQADGDLEIAKYGIIYLDEADKLAGNSSIVGKDISGRGVQFGLLKLMEETEVDLRSSHDIASQMKAFMDIQTKGKVQKEVINTKHILFIVSGAFTELRQIIEKRLSVGSLGIGGELKTDVLDSDLLKKVSTKDLIEYGFEPEFVGRLPIRVNCHELSELDLFDILKLSEGSIIKQYRYAFKSYGIDITFEDEALREIAKLAYREKTGARGLVTVLESILRDYKFELPSTSVGSFVVCKNLVNNPKEVLEKLIKTAKKNKKSPAYREIEKFEKDFKEKFGFIIDFDLPARDEILKIASKKKLSAFQVCEKTLSSYQHGFNLIKQNTGEKSFELGVEVIRKPEEVLEEWIKESYLKKAPLTDIKDI